MAISIDGSTGVISGVVAGGLPDGCVDADTLATDAVTSAKILDATIASGDLASGVGGKVLQVVYSELLTNIGTNSQSFVDTGLSVTITPSSATNYLLIMPAVEGGNLQNTFAFRIQLYISGGGTAGSVGNGTGVAGSQGDTRTSAMKGLSGGPMPNGSHGHNFLGGNVRVRCNDTVPNWSSGALTIKVQFSTNNSSYEAVINTASSSNTNTYSAPSSQLMVMEVSG
jgi:hypothetical protein